jgi:hypothetical protein
VHVSRRRMRRDMLRVIDRVSPSPWAIEAVVDGLARQFGREIRLVPWEFEQGPGLVSGVWVPTSIRDYIFYDYTVPVWRKNQIVGHELGHRLMNDTPRVHEWPEAIAHSLGDDVVGYQGRSDYEDAEEADAERFGTAVRRIAQSHERRIDQSELGRLKTCLQ